jgi:replication-associated recombination protein RarA
MSSFALGGVYGDQVSRISRCRQNARKAEAMPSMRVVCRRLVRRLTSCGAVLSLRAQVAPPCVAYNSARRFISQDQSRPVPAHLRELDRQAKKKP